jgi:WD40 repeat protein
MRSIDVDLKRILAAFGIVALAVGAGGCVAPTEEVGGSDLVVDDTTNVAATVSHNGHVHSLSFGSNKCLDVPGGTGANGAKIQIWDCSDGNNQKFRFDAKGNNYYQIVNLSSGKCLDIAGGGNGAALQQWDCSGGPNQLFRHEHPAAGAKTFALVSQAEGKCLDLSRGNYSNGNRVIQYQCNGQKNQTFSAKKF